ncbi:MAG: conjugal transfer protein, partial [Rhodocyclaceae bacterium]|nr:conjugal transfer protein [Rhodocyclaceae bacterium]
LRTPRINELATRRMRAENPELASSWDAMREAQRKQEEEERKQWAEERIREKEERRQEQNHSRGRTLRPPR